jgi:hypothetical protein
MKPQRAGFFRKLPHGDPMGPSLVGARAGSSYSDLREIVGYLRRGLLFIASPGLVSDVRKPNDMNQYTTLTFY